MPKLSLNGEVFLPDSQPLSNSTIAFWDGSYNYGWLASGVTDATGNFTVNLTEEVSDLIASGDISQIKYSVYVNDVIITSGVVGDYTVPITVNIEQSEYDDYLQADNESEVENITFYGRVSGANGIPLEGISIQVYENGLRQQFLLTTTTTNATGYYKAMVNTRNIGKTLTLSKRSLKVEFHDSTSTLIGTSKEYFDWTEDIVLNYTIEAESFLSPTLFEATKLVLESLTEGISLGTLTGNSDESNEVKYISEISGRSEGVVKRVVDAEKFAGETGMNAAMYFAVIADAMPGVNPITQLREATIRERISNAVDNNEIVAPEETDIGAFVAAAKTLQVTAALETEIGSDGLTAETALLSIFDNSQDVNDFLVAYNERDPEDMPSFWSSYASANSEALKDKAQLGLRVAPVLGFQNEMLASVMGDYTASGTQLHEYAKWGETEWYNYIDTVSTANSKLCVPSSISGNAADDTEAKTLYAQKLKSIVQNMYPATYIGGVLEGEDGDTLIADASVKTITATFIANNPNYDLREKNVYDLDEASSGLSTTDLSKLKEGLAPFQRLLRVTRGAPEGVVALKQAGLDSAFAITELSQEDFVSTYGAALGSEEEAQIVYGTATTIHYASHFTLSSFGPEDKVVGSPIPPPSTDFSTPGPQTPPEITTLFGSIDYCTCRECLSLYSPGAYMTDLLNFLKKHDNVGIKGGYTELLGRRSDLIHIDLTCKNANTVLPYIDLVNELLENQVLALNGITPVHSYQTSGSAASLAAYPEHVIKNTSGDYEDVHGSSSFEYVYDTILPTLSYYPSQNPFSLPTEEVKTYLEYLGKSRYEALKLLRPHDPITVNNGNPAQAQHISDYRIYSEMLGLNFSAASIITNYTEPNPYKFYGVKELNGFYYAVDPTNSSNYVSGGTDWAGLLKFRIDVLLRQAKVSYTELLQYLTTDFLNPKVNGDRTLYIKAKTGVPVDTCDTSELEIDATDAAAIEPFFKKLYRFNRLVKTGMLDIYQWDMLLRSLLISDSASATNPDMLTIEEFNRIGKVLTLSDKLGIDPLHLSAWWGDLDTHNYTNYSSEVQTSIPSVYDKIFRNKSVINQAVTPFPEAAAFTTESYVDNIAIIAAACGLRQDELLLITDKLGIDTVSSSSYITLSGLSKIFVFGKIAKAAGYSVADMMDLMELAGFPADMLTATTVTDFRDNTSFNVNGFASATTISDLDALIRLLELLAEYLPVVKNSGFSVEDFKFYLTNEDSTGKKSPLVDKIQVFYEDVRAELQKFPLYTFPASPSPEETAFHEMLRNIVLQHFSKEFDIPIEWSEKIITDSFIDTEILIGNFILSDNDDLEENNISSVISGSNHYPNYRLLNKNVAIAKQVKMTSEDYLTLFNLKDTYGFDWETLPTGTNFSGTPQLSGMLRLVAWLNIKNRLDLDDTSFYDLIESAGNNTTASTLSDIVKWRAEISKSLNADYLGILTDGASYPTDNLLSVNVGYAISGNIEANKYENVLFIGRLADIDKFCLQSGLSPVTVYTALRGDVQLADSHKILLAAKGKNTDEQWAKIAKPLRDKIRVKQRDALVGYLLANSDPLNSKGWIDENDLFAWLLIDVEMEACMQTSRIRQALSSIQLYADRIRLGLEYSTYYSDQISMTTQYSQQWEQWRKWYRVWEANRKVFLYPENWIEPELRDDKSEIFEALETDIAQNDITDEIAEDAIRKYLHQLNDVAWLDPVGVCDHVDDVLGTVHHVFARTTSDPQTYYYRTLINDKWSTWEKMDIEIKSDHIAPIVWNNRLYIFWLTFTERSVPFKKEDSYKVDNIWFHNEKESFQESNSSNSDTVPQPLLQVTLNWSEYKRGKWLKQQSSKETMLLKLAPTFDWHQIYNNVYNGQWDITGTELLYYLGTQYGASSSVNNFISTITKDKTLTLAEIVKSRIFLRLRITEESPNPTKLWCVLMTQTGGIDGYLTDPQMIYLHSFSFDDNDALPKVNRGHFGSDNFPALYGTVFQNMKFAENNIANPTQDLPLVEPKYLNYSGWTYTYQNNAISNVNYRIHDNARSVILANTEPNRYFHIVGKAPFADNPFENQFFFYDSKNHFFVRKVPLDITRTVAIREGDNETFDDWPLESELYNLSSSSSQSLFEAGNNSVSSGSNTILSSNFPKKYYFQTFYHPQANSYLKQLNSGGIEAVLSLANQDPSDTLNFLGNYQPTSLVRNTYPENKVDFDSWGAYSAYNWELFFHVPLLIAQRLSSNQQFADARKWFHYIFDPTESVLPAGSTNDIQRFWKFRPFYDVAGLPMQTLSDIMDLIRSNNGAILAQINDWENNPFEPHRIARMRTTAYMKNVVMKYLDNLIAWGDQLFAQDTIESINEATQLYILAENILGKRPTEVPTRVVVSPKSFDDLVTSGSLDAFSNAMVAIEAFLDPNQLSSNNSNNPNLPKVAYFCTSPNSKLLGYWDTVADRLFKIRNCMDIDGQTRQLSLYEPPIDPALLVKARAAGLNIATVINNLNTPASNYRFSYVLQKANEFVGDVKAFGNAILSALEKKDAEHLAALRSTQEVSLLTEIKQIKQSQLQEARTNYDALLKTKEVTQQRYEYYSSRPFLNSKEGIALKLQTASSAIQVISGSLSSAASFASAIPQFHLQGLCSGSDFGGQHVGAMIQGASTAVGIAASVMSADASMSATMGGYERRRDDWNFQANTAKKELEQLDKQILSAEIRTAIAQKELDNHELQIDNSREVDEYMRSKFTNEALYDWMIAQISATYFQAYQLAFEMAKKAEKSYKYELPLSEKAAAGFLKANYWDSLKKGLLAGERLQYDLRRMDAAYMEDNEREMELTKHVSLVMTSPDQLIELRNNGSCIFFIPEALYDLDYPGHYNRRIKSVSISIPCVTGPYTTINAKLRLKDSTYTKLDSTSLSTVYSPQVVSTSIATSSGQNDSGLFELNFRDERYLPFEGAGAASKWELELADPSQARLFDFDTITDVIMHIKYTARDGGSTIKNQVIADINGMLSSGATTDLYDLALPRYYSLKHEFPNQWFAYADGYATDSNVQMAMDFKQKQFPYFCKNNTVTIGDIAVVLKPKSDITTALLLQYFDSNDTLIASIAFSASATSSLYTGTSTLSVSQQTPTFGGYWKLFEDNNGSPGNPLDIDSLMDDIWVVAYYTRS